MKDRDKFIAGILAGAVVGGVGWLITRQREKTAISSAPLNVGEPFPSVMGTTLTGEALRLPDDLAGGVSLLIIGFDYAARFQVTDWARHVTERYGEQPNLRILQVAAIGFMGPLLRAVTDAAMERGTPEWAKQQVVTLYGDLRELRRRLLVDGGRDQAYLVLLGRTGRVAWKAMGPMSDEREALLDATLADQGITVHWKPA